MDKPVYDLCKCLIGRLCKITYEGVDPQVQYVCGGCDGVPEYQCDKEL